MTLPMKRGACFALLASDAMARASLPRVAGVFLHDTRHLSDYAWAFDGCVLLHHESDMGGPSQAWSRFSRHGQDVLVLRRLALRADGLDDDLAVRCESLGAQTLTPGLRVDADFRDSFALRGRARAIPRNPVARETREGGVTFSYEAQDGVRSATHVAWEGFAPGEALALAPGAERRLRVRVRFSTTLPDPTEAPGIAWAEAALALSTPAAVRARADLEALALATPQGPVLAAGVPNFACPFGRDGLIASWFLLAAAPPRWRRERCATSPPSRAGARIR